MSYKNHISKIIFAMLLASWGIPQAHAVGLGFSFGTGNEEWEKDRVNAGDRNVSNMGFVLDTAVRRNRVFNYRFSFLKEKNDADGNGINMEGYTTVHDFGFGVLRERNVRLWLGPQLRASYYEDIYLNSRSVPGDVVGFTVGPVIGVNVNMPQVVSFSFTAAYHILGGYAGDYNDTNSNIYYTDVDVDSNGLYLTAALIFRINE